MKKTILAILCLAFLISCKKTAGPEGPQGSTGPQGPAGPQGPQGNSSQGTGIIRGTVNQYDQYLMPYTTNLNTTTVSIEGTNISTITDAKGGYTLTNVSAGVLDLTYTRPNSGLVKHNQITFPGAGTLLLNKDIWDTPSYLFTGGYIKDTTVTTSTLPHVVIRLYFNPDSKERRFVIVYGKNPNLDLSDPTSFEGFVYRNIPENTSTFLAIQPYVNYPFNTISSLVPIYLKVYPISNGSFYDYNLNDLIMTGGGTPLAGTFTLTKP